MENLHENMHAIVLVLSCLKFTRKHKNMHSFHVFSPCSPFTPPHYTIAVKKSIRAEDTMVFP